MIYFICNYWSVFISYLSS